MSDIMVQGVSAGYNGRRVLEEVTLSVPERSWVGLIGPNGAGKTTLLRVIAALIPFSGRVDLAGEPVDSMSRRRLSRAVAYLPQRPILPEGVTVSDYVMLGRTPYIPYLGMESRHDRRVVAAVLQRLELDALADRQIGSLSGGETQRAVLARALAQQSPVLLLDEPTSALDVGHQQQVLDLIDRLRAEEGLTVVSALHDLTLAGQYTERLILLQRGRVMAEGPGEQVLTEELIARHFHASVRVESVPGSGPTVIPIRSRTAAVGAVEPGKRPESGCYR